jgi:predicted ATPase
MRSEDFFGFAKRVAREMAAMKRALEDEDDDHKRHKGQSEFGRSLAMMPYARELHTMRELYGEGLDAQSHGESYFKLFRSRFRPGGLYLMDEPEAPLSPTRQLTLIAMLKQMIEQDAQFIIATHSPIILAYPGATIYNFADGRIEHAEYESLEHVSVTRGFLENPDAYLRHLLE